MDNYGVDYAGLKAGVYLQVGASIKKLEVNRGTDDSWLALFGFEGRVDDATLSNKEAWTFTALSRRAEWIQSVPHAWMQGDTEMDDAPFGIEMRPLLAQLDKALQTKEHGAFLYKLRGAGKMVTKMVWLDPDTITPDLDTATHKDGIKKFWRDKEKGGKEVIKPEDLVWFKRPGQKELQSDPAPLEASRKSAEVLYNMGRLEDFFFEGAGLPIMLVMVPAGTSDTDRDEMRNVFHRLANALRSPREIRTIGVREGVTVEQLSFSPKDLDLAPTEERNRNKVLGVHQVPQSVAMSNAANYATATSDQVQFANTMATRLEAIAEVFNADPDFMMAGYALDVRRNELPVLQEEERQRAQAYSLLVAGKIHPEAAVAMLGFDVPEGYEGPIFVENMEPDTPPPTDEPDGFEVDEEVKSWAWNDERRQLTNWLKKPGRDIADFKTNHLTDHDKAAIAYQVSKGGAASQDAPFRRDADSQTPYP
jgi:hypothetical protein